MSTMSNLDELERLLEAATPGPWYACVWDPMERSHISLAEGDHHPNKDIARELSKENAALAVAAVNSLPALIAAARRAEALDVKRLAAAIESVKMLDSIEGPDIAEFSEAIAAEYATLTEEGAPR